jgi:hypothetical protein
MSQIIIIIIIVIIMGKTYYLSIDFVYDKFVEHNLRDLNRHHIYVILLLVGTIPHA